MITEKLRKYLLPNLPYLLIFWFGDKLGEAYRLAAGNNLFSKIGGISKTLNTALASPLPGIQPRDLLVGAAAAGIIYAVVYFKKKNAKKYRNGVEHGSARWGNPEDIKPYVDPKPENNVILTQTESLTMSSRPKNPAQARNKNVLIVGGSGSGKTRFFIKPNLMQCQSKDYPVSFVVTDPKGLVFRGRRNPHKTKENLRVCRRWHYDRTSNENYRIVRAFEP